MSGDLWRELEREFRQHEGAGVYAFEVVGGGWCIQVRGGGREVQPVEQTFVDCATRAAVAAGLPLADPVTSWLTKLKDRSDYSRPDPAVQVWFDTRKEWVSLEGGCIDDVFEASASACRSLAASLDVANALTHDGRPTDKAERQSLARNIKRLKKECGWTFEDMAKVVGVSPDSAKDHVNHGVRPYPDTLAAYANAFSEKLGRPISVEDLEKP